MTTAFIVAMIALVVLPSEEFREDFNYSKYFGQWVVVDEGSRKDSRRNYFGCQFWRGHQSELRGGVASCLPLTCTSVFMVDWL